MSLLRPLAVAALATASALLSALATPAAAQSRSLFRWTGDVDREVVLVVRGADVDQRGEWSRGRARVNAPLPRTAGALDVRVEEGRGRVDVLQQPSDRNDWTGIVRIRDERGGADRYRVVAHWVPTRGGWDDRGGWGRGRDDDDDRGGWGRDGRDRDRGRGRDRDRDWPDRDGDGDRDRDDRRAGRGEPGQLRWAGLVDDVVEIRIQGGRVDQLTRRGTLVRDVRADLRGAPLPARDDVTVRLRDWRGRGQVVVVEQPSARNGYTAVLRVVDPAGGADRYELVATW